MNSLFRFRFTWLALLLSITLFSSCKKDNIVPVAPADLADQVAGTYQYTELTSNGKTYPASETNLRGQVSVSRETATSVSFAFAIMLKSGSPFLDDTYSDVSVREANGEVIYEVDGQFFAKSKGNKLTISGYDTDNKPFTLTTIK